MKQFLVVEVANDEMGTLLKEEKEEESELYMAKKKSEKLKQELASICNLNEKVELITTFFWDI